MKKLLRESGSRHPLSVPVFLRWSPRFWVCVLELCSGRVRVQVGVLGGRASADSSCSWGA